MASVSGNKRASVKRLHATDPYNKNSAPGVTQATFGKGTEILTNNPNPLYDPTPQQTSMKEVSVASARKAASKPGKASRGHAKVIKRTAFNQNAGKTLKRKQF
jgi:hypothetical protein